MVYIYLALLFYILSLATGFLNFPLASAIFSVASAVSIGVVLIRLFRSVNTLKESYWEKLADIWIGAEYPVVIMLYVFSSVGVTLLGYFLLAEMPRFDIGTTEPRIVVGLAVLAMGIMALALVGLVAMVYLIEVFNRDLYLIQLAAGVKVFRPHAATFYVVLSIVTLGFLYFYWLYLAWRWATQLTQLRRL